jgi:hypothetical protein
MTHRKSIALALVAVLAILGLSGCKSAADKASENLSKAAENFEVPRRIVGVNGITDNVLFSVEGFCSYETGGDSYDVTCKEPDGQISRTTMAKSDNVTIVVTQMGGVDVDLFHSRVVFRPENIIPDFDLQTSND